MVVSTATLTVEAGVLSENVPSEVVVAKVVRPRVKIRSRSAAFEIMYRLSAASKAISRHELEPPVLKRRASGQVGKAIHQRDNHHRPGVAETGQVFLVGATPR